MLSEPQVRFHIMAMHELCEIPKGEGTFEGFDAHLNIEQMNKTCVDLFQMYDDFRAEMRAREAAAAAGEGGGEGGEWGEEERELAGRALQCEAELRGYYGLLKIDKHPGFKVSTTDEHLGFKFIMVDKHPRFLESMLDTHPGFEASMLDNVDLPSTQGFR